MRSTNFEYAGEVFMTQSYRRKVEFLQEKFFMYVFKTLEK